MRKEEQRESYRGTGEDGVTKRDGGRRGNRETEEKCNGEKGRATTV